MFSDIPGANSDVLLLLTYDVMIKAIANALYLIDMHDGLLRTAANW